MNLRDYLNKNDIRIEEFACHVGVSVSSLWHYFSGIRRPSKNTAALIQWASDGQVTIEEMRGKECNKKRPEVTDAKARI